MASCKIKSNFPTCCFFCGWLHYDASDEGTTVRLHMCGILYLLSEWPCIFEDAATAEACAFPSRAIGKNNQRSSHSLKRSKAQFEIQVQSALWWRQCALWCALKWHQSAFCWHQSALWWLQNVLWWLHSALQSHQNALWSHHSACWYHQNGFWYHQSNVLCCH